MLVNKTALVEQYLPLMQKVVKDGVGKMRKQGLIADRDELESDAALVLLQLADKYVADSCKHSRAYFEKCLWQWLNQRYQNLRKRKNSTTSYSDDPEFDVAAPVYISDDEYQEQYDREQELEAELYSDPELKLAMRLLQDGGVKAATAEFGKRRWYTEIVPKFKTILEVE